MSENTKNALVVRKVGELASRTPGQIAHEETLGRIAEEVGKHARAKSTRKMYAWAWGRFLDFCDRRGFVALPASPETVKIFLTSCATGLPPDARLDRDDDPDEGLPRVSVGTVNVIRAALAARHTESGLTSPCASPLVQEQMKALRRLFGRPARKRRAFGLELLQKVVEPLGSDLRSLRDRAILTTLYSGAFRRSELCAMNVEDLRFEQEGLIVTIPRSKTDKEGRGAEVPLHFHADENTCPVRSIQAWLQEAGITEGRVFRGIRAGGLFLYPAFGGQRLAEMLRRRLSAVGLPESEVKHFAGHSPRRGLLTDAGREGATIKEMQKYSRHKTAQMVVEYQEQANRLQADTISRMFNKPKAQS